MSTEERIPRVKGSGDHNWEPWSQATLGRGRVCLDCGHEDDGYQYPCKTTGDAPDPWTRPDWVQTGPQYRNARPRTTEPDFA